MGWEFVPSLLIWKKDDIWQLVSYYGFTICHSNVPICGLAILTDSPT